MRVRSTDLGCVVAQSRRQSPPRLCGDGFRRVFGVKNGCAVCGFGSIGCDGGKCGGVFLEPGQWTDRINRRRGEEGMMGRFSMVGRREERRSECWMCSASNLLNDRTRGTCILKTCRGV
ncbi:uncharacterized protein [Physcomitrium patens]|uniref:Uncharacterized protein n=1 Tax=Physcomitrium patens TaxID=3218 RepID=A0A2K1KCX3_PHYPA|nr:uncharacterized protein LOC112284229 [Physcomitrium patens]PNR51611.1 hypothetical protein PHYPA_010798 [Physcomitrium patens]|eukprot:XP_024379627.1 uncharacterized protein LOC112284229 [Physcomitrella patens]